eukprot:6852107-Alexandrium_andersonii.AAC.1
MLGQAKSDCTSRLALRSVHGWMRISTLLAPMTSLMVDALAAPRTGGANHWGRGCCRASCSGGGVRCTSIP